MLDLTLVLVEVSKVDIPKVCRMLSRGCKSYPYRFAANVAQLCGFLAEQGELDTIVNIMNHLRSNSQVRITAIGRKKCNK